MIYQLADGRRTLRLTEFETSNGPEVHVYLIAAAVEKGNDAVKAAGFIDLGSMKGNKGDQNYDIPVDADLSFDLVCALWCKLRYGRLGLGKELMSNLVCPIFTLSKREQTGKMLRSTVQALRDPNGHFATGGTRNSNGGVEDSRRRWAAHFADPRWQCPIKPSVYQGVPSARARRPRFALDRKVAFCKRVILVDSTATKGCKITSEWTNIIKIVSLNVGRPKAIFHRLAVTALRT